MPSHAAARNRCTQPPAAPPRAAQERPTAAFAASAFIGPVMSFPRNAEIYGENEPAGYLYRIVSGAVRTSKVLVDGRRQIGTFYLPGDLFGLEAGVSHGCSAEAITHCRVVVIKRATVEALAAGDRTVARHMWMLTARELQRTQARLTGLIRSAQERVAGFLLEMAERATDTGFVELPMSRQDIADYLGLTIETVSRTLTSLEHAAVIEMPTSRRIRLRDPAALRRLDA